MMMIPSTFVTLVAVLSSLATANGAVIQRQGTFTYTTPQPTSAGGAPTSTLTGATTSPVPTSSVPTTTASVPTTNHSYPTTTPSTTPTVTATVPVSPPPTTSSAPVTTSTPPATTASIPVPVSKNHTQSATPTTSPITASSPVSSTPTATPTGGSVDCNNAQSWQAAFAYTAGAQAIYNGQLFTAKQWTYNNAPPLHTDQWTLVGTCAQPINNKASCSGISAWEGNVAYTSGNRVTFQDHLWSAVQWTYANSPGDASGSWQDLGACA